MLYFFIHLSVICPFLFNPLRLARVAREELKARTGRKAVTSGNAKKPLGAGREDMENKKEEEE